MTDDDIEVNLAVNGHLRTVGVHPDSKLLTVLRNEMGLNGPKYGCGLAQCGACTVLVDGTPARACIYPAKAMEGRDIITMEGLTRDGRLHPVQRAFVEENGAQCGYCLNGMLMTVVALLARNPHPTEAQVRAELRYNLCRCGAHVEILKAARRAAEILEKERSEWII